MSLVIEQYSEKAIVVRGESKDYKDKLAELGGKFNAMLKGGPGWIFPNSKKSKVEDLNKEIASGKVTKSVTVSSNSSFNPKEFVSAKAYLDLVSRVEKLEQLVAHLQDQSLTVEALEMGSESNKSENNESEEESEEDDPKDKQKVERLMRKK